MAEKPATAVKGIKMSHLLEIKDLKASVEDNEILSGIDLCVDSGEVHVIMGPNRFSSKRANGVLSLGENSFSNDWPVVFTIGCSWKPTVS